MPANFLGPKKEKSLRNSVRFLILVCPLVFVLIGYQNCSEGFKSSLASGNSILSSIAAPTTGLGSSTPTPLLFKAGDTFDYTKIPNQSQQMKLLLSTAGYPLNAIFSAMAIASNGLGGTGYSEADGSQQAADHDAIAACNIISRLPCAIVAEGNSFALSSDQLNSHFSSVMTIPTAVGIGMNPTNTSSNNDSFYQYYASAQSPKAAAIDQSGYSFFVYTDSNDPYRAVSDKEVERQVLEGCELGSSQPPCTLLAVNNSIVFNLSDLNLYPVIDYNKKTVGGSIPTMTDAYFQFLETTYFSKIPAQQFSFAMNPDMAATGQPGVPGSDTASQALATCNSEVPKGEDPCFHYSENLNILMTAQNTHGFQKAHDLYCYGTIRESCEVHALMGCTDSAMYYILQNDLPTLVQCN